MSGTVTSMRDQADRPMASFATAAGMSPSAAHRRAAKRAAPFSIRLTVEERAALESAAAGRPLGTYIRSRILDNVPVERRPQPRRPIEDQKAMSRVLGRLGQSGLGLSLEGLAKAAQVGALTLSPDVVAQLIVACNEVRAMRLDLMRALGLREGS